MEKSGSGLLRLSFNFMRRMSTSAATSNPSSTVTASVAKRKKKKNKKNLFEVAQFLPNWGVGYHLAKAHWTGVSYQITKLNLYKDGKHGKAWGIVHKDGPLTYSSSLRESTRRLLCTKTKSSVLDVANLFLFTVWIIDTRNGERGGVWRPSSFVPDPGTIATGNVGSRDRKR